MGTIGDITGKLPQTGIWLPHIKQPTWSWIHLEQPHLLAPVHFSGVKHRLMSTPHDHPQTAWRWLLHLSSPSYSPPTHTSPLHAALTAGSHTAALSLLSYVPHELQLDNTNLWLPHQKLTDTKEPLGNEGIFFQKKNFKVTLKYIKAISVTTHKNRNQRTMGKKKYLPQIISRKQSETACPTFRSICT